MLGMFSLLPILKGWQYKNHTVNSILAPGETAEGRRISELGWLIDVALMSTDAYGGVKIQYQDADLQTHEISGSAEDGRIIGAFQQDPSGWVARYFRPNPYSTAGLYFTALFTGGWQGAVWPFVPTTVINMYLGKESTQAQASVSAVAYVIAITNKELFIQSLRQVLDSQLDIEVPPELLSLGPIPLTQQQNKTNQLLEAILAQVKQQK